MTILAFDPNPHCPKCQWSEVGYAFTEATTLPQKDEHIALTCERCAYAWEMVPEDGQGEL